MHVFDLEELESATDHFSPSQLIGKGSHGSVYRGLLKDGNLAVAIKKQSLALQKLRDNTKLENEASILSPIPPNFSCLIDLLGVSHDAYGNLSSLIVQNF
ncbi:putative wall-associated receptor kinase-like 11 [Phtheirospermum japonicum]|uniref:Putative wall-associated receptor kinase-like 11 n=1 Tax=Phtheirospermum japonicum TaxID=374723 RepID=A0A830BEM5_9LAMI|nr:putative wall-associated receptor kinase-like 11 [Phtheirospermum japonicum]